METSLFPTKLYKKDFSVSANHSPAPWVANKNNSWPESYVKEYGNRSGYVIGYEAKNHLATLATVIATPFVSQLEIDCNAKLIIAAPSLLKLAESISKLDQSKQSAEVIEIINLANSILKPLQ